MLFSYDTCLNLRYSYLHHRHTFQPPVSTPEARVYHNTNTLRRGRVCHSNYEILSETQYIEGQGREPCVIRDFLTKNWSIPLIEGSTGDRSEWRTIRVETRRREDDTWSQPNPLVILSRLRRVEPTRDLASETLFDRRYSTPVSLSDTCLGTPLLDFRGRLSIIESVGRPSVWRSAHSNLCLVGVGWEVS